MEILGITVDSNLDFNTHISNICRKAGNKLYAIARLKPYIHEDKLILLIKAYVTSQFNYCPLLWAFTSRSNNNKVNNLHERALRLVEGNSDLNFGDLLQKFNCKSSHTSNICQLMIVLFKCLRNMGPSYLQEIFQTNNSRYSLRNPNDFKLPRANTVNYGTETLSFRGPQIWGNLHSICKRASSLEDFIRLIKKFERFPCQCRLCADYIHQIGYI